jgi:lysophospholipase L1-like esterase
VKKVRKPILMLLLSALLMMLFSAPAMAAAYTTQSRGPVNYLALGDSVAAGVLYGDENYPGGGSGLGYTDDIARLLEYNHALASFNNTNPLLCRAGMTAQELCANISEKLKDENKGTVEYKLMQNADIITLDVGANDFLGEFYDYISANSDDIQKIIDGQADEAVTEQIVADIQNVLNTSISSLYNGKGAQVQKYIQSILQNILRVNPDVRIYVMGYYNPLPVMKSYGMDLSLPVAYFNTFIYRAINDVRKSSGSPIAYIATMLPMSNALKDGLLYPYDIHPSARGYRVIANLFWARIKLDFLLSLLGA